MDQARVQAAERQEAAGKADQRAAAAEARADEAPRRGHPRPRRARSRVGPPPGRARRRVSDRYVRNLLHRLASQAGIDKQVRPHGLRHTYAAELEKAGLTVSEISKLLGHSSAAVTARYLDHLTNDRAVTALEAAELPELDDTRPPSSRRRPRRTA